MFPRELSHAAIPRVSVAISIRAGGACWFGFRRWVGSMWLLFGRLMAMIPGVKSLVILMAWISCGCVFLAQTHPSKLPDYQASEHPYYYVNFHAGEWYELRKPMFLVISTSNALRITRPGYGSPRLDLFLNDEKKREELVRSYRVQRLLPAGTRIRLMSVKFVNGETPFPFFYVDENYQWVEASFRENFGVDNRITGPEMRRRLGGKRIGKEVEFVWDYDREWFRKVE